MDQGAIRQSKLLYLGFPFLLLILYLVWVPSPSVNKVYIQSDLGYLADGYDLTILRLKPRDQIARLSSVTFGFTVRDLTFAPGYVYVTTSDSVVHIIDISNPSSPKKLIEFATGGVPESIAVNGTTFFIGDHIGNVHILVVNSSGNAFPKGIVANLGMVSDVEVIGNLIYIAKGAQGLDIYDISNPAAPMRLSQYNPGGYIEKVVFQQGTPLNEGEAIKGLLIVDEHTLQIVDFTNSQQPLLLNSFDFGSAKIEQAFVSGRNLFVALRRGGFLISSINSNGQLEQLANINIARNTLGVAILDDTAYLATGFEGLKVVDIAKLDNIYSVGTGYSRFLGHKIWIISLNIFFLLIWSAFFAQFVLPVRMVSQRLRIFGRLIIFLLGKHGPAIFVENGLKVQRKGESEKKGPGVIWMDTASAGVIRTATKFKEAIGPGVHFTKKGESLAGTLDLHIQVDSLGPSEEDKSFEKRTNDQSEEVYRQVQNRRKMTSALTRDGIEVVPNIRIVFRVNTEPAKGDEFGSRFGYRTGMLRREKENEEKDQDAIYRAITSEGIDPTVPGGTPRHRIAWNQLPGRLAVDVWREYVAKFTLDELFISTRDPLSKSRLSPEPEPEDIEPLNHPVHVGANQETDQSSIVDMLGVINRSIAGFADWIESKQGKTIQAPKGHISTGSTSVTKDSAELPKQTALQVISEMIQKRLTQSKVEVLDNTGNPGKGTIDSNEYRLLHERGLKVLSVSISNLRFNELVERHLLEQWKANWYNNAKAERERIERRRRYVEIRGEEEGSTEYVHTLARHIMLQRPRSKAELLRALLMRTRLTIVRNNQLQHRMSAERQDIEDLLQWVEKAS